MRDVILIGSIAIAMMLGWTTASSPDLVRGGDTEQARKIKPCQDIYDPVICTDGVVYGNLCYARNAGAHRCKPYGLP